MVRQIIADNNGINYHFAECSYKGDCLGFCEKCDIEVRYLEGELKKRVEQGYDMQLACIAYPSFLDSLLDDAGNSIDELITIQR